MNPSPLDESLLTAYLDDELSDSEREVVEEQLKTNEHWKRLLAELQSIQCLIRELPTPVLARSLAVAPWTNPILPNAVLDAREKENDTSKHRSIPTSVLALAAGLFLCVLGSFAWMRFSVEQNELAKLEKMANPADSPTSTSAAAPAALETVNDPAMEALTPVSDIELKVEKPTVQSSDLSSETSVPATGTEGDLQARGPQLANPKLKLQSATPSAALKNEASDELNVALNAGLAPSMGLQTAQTTSSPEPVGTLHAVRIRSADKAGVDAIGQENKAQDLKSSRMRNQVAAPPSNDFYFQDPNSNRIENLSLLERTPNQRQELRIRHSDVPMILEQLRDLGWEVQGDGGILEDDSTDLGQIRSLGESSEEQVNIDKPRPPTLTGAIIEPTDWIRIIFDVDAK